MNLLNLIFPQKWRESDVDVLTDDTKLSLLLTFSSYQNVDKLRRLDLHEIAEQVKKDCHPSIPSCWTPSSIVWTDSSTFLSRLFKLSRITLCIKYRYQRDNNGPK